MPGGYFIKGTNLGNQAEKILKRLLLNSITGQGKYFV